MNCSRNSPQSAFSLVELLIVLAVMVILAALLYPLYWRVVWNSTDSSCQSNLKQIGLGFAQYVQDYNERFPLVRGSDAPTKTRPYGWVDTLQPYMRSYGIFHCTKYDWHPTTGTDPAKKGCSDYWMNSRLSGLSLEKLSEAKVTLMVGDGKDQDGASDSAGDGRYAIPSLPIEWRTNQNSPAHRHEDGANYLFADDHVKWLKPNDVQNEASPSVGKPTFRPTNILTGHVPTRVNSPIKSLR